MLPWIITFILTSALNDTFFMKITVLLPKVWHRPQKTPRCQAAFWTQIHFDPVAENISILIWAPPHPHQWRRLLNLVPFIHLLPFKQYSAFDNSNLSFMITLNSSNLILNDLTLTPFHKNNFSPFSKTNFAFICLLPVGKFLWIQHCPSIKNLQNCVLSQDNWPEIMKSIFDPPIKNVKLHPVIPTRARCHYDSQYGAGCTKYATTNLINEFAS